MSEKLFPDAAEVISAEIARIENRISDYEGDMHGFRARADELEEHVRQFKDHAMKLREGLETLKGCCSA